MRSLHGSNFATLPSALVLIMAAGAGCTGRRDKEADIANGDRPLDALTVNVASTWYENAYWSRQSDSNTTVWQEAKAYCEKNGVTDQGQKLNCGPVIAARYEETARHPKRRKPEDLRP